MPGSSRLNKALLSVRNITDKPVGNITDKPASI
jgi:hypothetical protein